MATTWLDSNEAAAIVGTTRRTMYRKYVDLGHLPRHRFGSGSHHDRFLLDDVNALVTRIKKGEFHAVAIHRREAFHKKGVVR